MNDMSRRLLWKVDAEFTTFWHDVRQAGCIVLVRLAFRNATNSWREEGKRVTPQLTSTTTVGLSPSLPAAAADLLQFFSSSQSEISREGLIREEKENKQWRELRVIHAALC